jgi:cell division protein FtsQ
MALQQRRPKQQRYGGKQKAPLALRQKLAILVAGFLLLLAALAGLGFLVYKALGHSDFFQVTATNIQGCRRTTKNLILELSGVDVHSNMLSLELAKVRGSIEAHEWIESAEVRRVWPNMLSITVKERLPVAIVSRADGLHYLDQHGAAFAPALPPEEMDYPFITGLEREEWPVGPGDSLLGEALQFIKYAGQGGTILPRQNISEIHISGSEGLLLYLADRPFPIHLGQGDMHSKYVWLTRVLYRLYKNKEFARTAYIRMGYGPRRVLVGFDGPV